MADAPKNNKRSKHFLFSWRNAVYKSDLSSSEKFTLITISMFMTSRGFNSFPSIKLLAEKTSLSERSIKRAVKKISETGFISIAKKRDGKDWNHNQYTATFPKKTIAVEHHQDNKKADHQEKKKPSGTGYEKFETLFLQRMLYQNDKETSPTRKQGILAELKRRGVEVDE